MGDEGWTGLGVGTGEGVLTGEGEAMGESMGEAIGGEGTAEVAGTHKQKQSVE